MSKNLTAFKSRKELNEQERFCLIRQKSSPKLLGREMMQSSPLLPALEDDNEELQFTPLHVLKKYVSNDQDEKSMT